MKVIEKDSFLVVGLKVIVKEHEMFIKMPKFHQQFYRLIDKIQHRINDHILDICLKKENDEYTQLVCVEVNEINPIPLESVGFKIPKAKYLYHEYNGEIEGIYQAYVEMYDYALNNGLLLDKDEFKIEDFDINNKTFHLYLKIMN